MEVLPTALRQVVVDFLNAQYRAVLAVLDHEGLPTSTPIFYVVDDELNMYYCTRRSFAKYHDTIARPVVAITVPGETASVQKAVNIQGIATEARHEELRELYEFFKQKNPLRCYFEGTDDFTMVRVTPQAIRFLDGTSGALTITDVAPDALLQQ